MSTSEIQLLTLKIITLQNEVLWTNASVHITTDDHAYSFFYGHAETTLILKNAKISWQHNGSNKKIEIAKGICHLKNNTITCLTNNYAM